MQNFARTSFWEVIAVSPILMTRTYLGATQDGGFKLLRREADMRSRFCSSPVQRVILLDQKQTFTDLLEQGTPECNPLVEILNHLAIAVIIVDRQLQIVHANAAAGELLLDGRLLSSVRGALTANDARNHEVLRRVIREPDSDTKLVCLETERRVTIATVLSLSSSQHETYGKWRSASAAIFVHSQPSFDKGLENTLGIAFGLTGVETRVLSALLEGLCLPAIATRHQITVNTVRWHLKQLFVKTNTRRQSDLIRIASGAIAPVRAIRKEKSGGYAS